MLKKMILVLKGYWMKKMWKKKVKGKERKYEIIFKFNKEIKKIIRGYKKCRKDED
jgi:hypothetical protein